MLLIDGVRYHLHEFKEEKDFEGIVEEHTKDIFGEESIYFGKKKIQSLSGIRSIPDGFAITFWEAPQWYVVEVELSRHPLQHVLSQITMFITAIKSDRTKRELVDFMYRGVQSQPIIEHLIRERFGEAHKFLSDIIYKNPTILIIVDKKTKELEDAVNNVPLGAELLELNTFEREGVGLAVHAHLFEPLFIPQPPPQAPLKPVTAPAIRVGEVKAGDALEIVVKQESCRKYTLFYFPTERRRFFPGYKTDFILETDVGEIVTRVTSDLAEKPKGDPDAGHYIRRGLGRWYEKHPEVTIGTKIRFQCVEPYKKYSLTIV